MARAQAQAADAAALASLRASEAAAAQAAGSQAQIESLAAQQGLATRQAERMDQMGDAVTVSARDQARAQADALGQQLAATRHSSAAASRQARAAAEQERASREQASAATQGIQAAEASLRRVRVSVSECELYAPLSGAVETLALDVGELAMPGTVLARLVDTSSPRATFYLPNAELATVRPGASATVRADAYPDRTFPARVITVAHQAEFIQVTPLRPGVLMVGKVTPFVLIGLMDVGLALAVGAWVFGVPLRGNLGLVAGATLLYVMSTLGVGLLIATLSRTQQQAFVGGFLFLLPAVLLSGVLTPVRSMPDWLAWVTWLNPVRYYVEVLRGVLLKSASLADLWLQLLLLALFGVAVLTIASRRFHKTAA